MLLKSICKFRGLCAANSGPGIVYSPATAGDGLYLKSREILRYPGEDYIRIAEDMFNYGLVVDIHFTLSAVRFLPFVQPFKGVIVFLWFSWRGQATQREPALHLKLFKPPSLEISFLNPSPSTSVSCMRDFRGRRCGCGSVALKATDRTHLHLNNSSSLQTRRCRRHGLYKHAVLLPTSPCVFLWTFLSLYPSSSFCLSLCLSLSPSTPPLLLSLLYLQAALVPDTLRQR